MSMGFLLPILLGYTSKGFPCTDEKGLQKGKTADCFSLLIKTWKVLSRNTRSRKLYSIKKKRDVSNKKREAGCFKKTRSRWLQKFKKRNAAFQKQKKKRYVR